MKNKEVFNNKFEKLEDLYNKYPVLHKSDIKNNGAISDYGYLKNLYSD
ncbi:hypothetical protein [Clostridium sp. C2-6-12]|nr:hypothetical protein [Clostridium sp. C2-6-12]